LLKFEGIVVMKRPISANISLSLEAAIPEDIFDNESSFLCMPSKEKFYAKTKSPDKKTAIEYHCQIFVSSDVVTILSTNSR